MFRLTTLIGLFLICAACGSLLAQEKPAPATPPDPQTLTEVEALKGENLTLKYDSLDKQARLMQEQFARLQDAQRDIVQQLQALEKEVIAAHGFKPGEASVNWQTRTVAPVPKPEVRK